MKKTVSDYFVIALGSFLLSLAITCFLVPVKISTGGISGIATILYYFLNIPISVTTFIINIILFAFGYKTLKKATVLKNLAGILFLSLFLNITEYLGHYTEDILMCSVFGGILVGVGVGLVVSKDGSTGGSDFAALMINKKLPHIGVAYIIFAIDSAIILLSAVAFENVTVMFYSVLSLYISSKVTDFILVRGDFAKSLYILSEKNDEISGFIMSELNRGVTGIYSKGCFRGNDSVMLMCVVKSKEVSNILNEIKNIDSSAFVIISEVREVCGRGFKKLK